jgi:MFS family permease
MLGAPLSAWAPLRLPFFRNLWLASIISNVGSWMQDTAGTWLMTVLTKSALLIALMQTAASLPVLFLGFFAGATADIFDRRRLLIIWQSWMLAAVGILAALTLTTGVLPWTLLGLTFLMNIGSAMNNPAWAAIVPELVPREQLPEAVAINSAGFNIARAVGPALGGLLVGAFISALRGAGIVFLLNALSFIAVVFVLYGWRRNPPYKSALPAERLSGSLHAGWRYVRHAPALQAILIRTFLFALMASAVWALLAVVAAQDLHRGAMAYGILNGCIGLGAVLGASLLPRVRQRFTGDQIATYASIIFAATLLVMGVVHYTAVLLLFLIATGFAWTSTASTLNVSVQLSVPYWVQARALGIYQTVFWGGLAAGSALWGYLAEHSSTSKSLVASAACMLLIIPLGRRYHLLRGTPPDLTPYRLNRPAPQLAIEPHHEDGPVLITIEYNIRPEDSEAFVAAMHRVRLIRMRDGAIRWGIFRDTVKAERFVETFVTESWLEFLRERERMTTADRAIRDQAWSFHQGPPDPPISYMIYAPESARR